MIVRELLTKLGVQFDDSGAKKADAAVTGLKSGLQSLIGIVGGVALVRGMANLVVQQVRLADAVGDTAERLGIGVEALQELRFAGEDVGLSAEGVDAALGRLVRGTAEAARGQGEAKDAFRELGVQLTDGQGNLRSFDEVLTQVADGLGNTSTDADRLRLAYKIFGREGATFAATMANGAEGMEEMRLRARELGGVLSQDQVDAADKADKAISGFNFALSGLKHQIASEFIPALTRGLGFVSRWVNGFRELARSSNLVTGVLVTVGALGAAMAVAFGGARLLGLAKAAVALGLIALAIDEFKTWTEGGNTLIGRLIDKFNGLGASATHLENWKAGLKIMAETAERWLGHLQAGLKILDEIKSRNAAKETAAKEVERRAAFESQHAAWQRKKEWNENPLVPDWAKMEAGPEPVWNAPAGKRSAFEELRTRRVGTVRGMGQGPFAIPGGAESAEERAAEQYRQAEAVRVAQQSAASSAVNVNQTVNVNVEGGGSARETAAMIDARVRKALTDNNAATMRSVRQVPP